jgi:hypothetical protein
MSRPAILVAVVRSSGVNMMSPPVVDLHFPTQKAEVWFLKKNFGSAVKIRAVYVGRTESSPAVDVLFSNFSSGGFTHVIVKSSYGTRTTVEMTGSN